MKYTQVVLLLLSVITNSFSQSSCDCNPTYFKDAETIITDKETAYSFYQTIQSEQFEYLKKNGNVSATIPFFDLIIEGSASYEEFKSNLKRYFSSESRDIYTKSHSEIIKSKFQNNGYNAYYNCLAACQNTVGLFIIILNSDKQYVTAKIKYSVPQGINLPNITVSSSSIKNGTVDNTPNGALLAEGTTLTPGQEITIIINRADPSKAVMMAVNAGNFSNSANVGPVIQPKPCENLGKKDFIMYQFDHFYISKSKASNQYNLTLTRDPQPEINNTQWHLKKILEDRLILANDPTPKTNENDDRKYWELEFSDICHVIKYNQ